MLGLLHSAAYFCGLLTLALHLVGRGWDEWAAGVTLGVTQVVSAGAALAGGALVDRLGSRRVMWWTLSLATIGQATIGLFMLPLAAVAGWALVACANAVFLTAATHRLNDLRQESGNKVFPHFYVALSLGSLLAPLLSSGLMRLSDSTRSVFLTAAGLLAISLVSYIGAPKGPAPIAPPPPSTPSARRMDGIDVAAGSWVVGAAAVTVMGATGLNGFFYLYTADLDISLQTAGVVLTIGQIGLFLPRLSAKTVERATNDAGLVVAGVFIAGVGGLVLGLGTVVAALVVGVLLAGLGRGVSQPATASIVSAIVPPHVAGRFLGLRAAAMQLAGGVGSLMFGVFASLGRIDLAFVTTGVLAMLVMVALKFTSVPRRIRLGSRGPRLATSTPQLGADGRYRLLGADHDVTN